MPDAVLETAAIDPGRGVIQHHLRPQRRDVPRAVESHAVHRGAVRVDVQLEHVVGGREAVHAERHRRELVEVQRKVVDGVADRFEQVPLHPVRPHVAPTGEVGCGRDHVRGKRQARRELLTDVREVERRAYARPLRRAHAHRGLEDDRPRVVAHAERAVFEQPHPRKGAVHEEVDEEERRNRLAVVTLVRRDVGDGVAQAVGGGLAFVRRVDDEQGVLDRLSFEHVAEIFVRIGAGEALGEARRPRGAVGHVTVPDVVHSGGEVAVAHGRVAHEPRFVAVPRFIVVDAQQVDHDVVGVIRVDLGPAAEVHRHQGEDVPGRDAEVLRRRIDVQRPEHTVRQRRAVRGGGDELVHRLPRDEDDAFDARALNDDRRRHRRRADEGDGGHVEAADEPGVAAHVEHADALEPPQVEATGDAAVAQHQGGEVGRGRREVDVVGWAAPVGLRERGEVGRVRHVEGDQRLRQGRHVHSNAQTVHRDALRGERGVERCHVEEPGLQRAVRRRPVEHQGAHDGLTAACDAGPFRERDVCFPGGIPR
mmetsp:Transcript_41267/g.127442  ORF Transcript_41267/g.127442 Transcript_41267/m.127442 type:complete len:536 (+) Transcript_41267:3223-4830(+)